MPNHKFTRRFTAAATALLAVSAMSACSEAADNSDPNRELLLVGIPKALDNPAYAVARNGAEKRAEELGNIKLEWAAPAGADAAKQVELVENYTQRGADGIFIAPLGPSVCLAIDNAIEAGLEVITFDSDCEDSARPTYVGADNYQGGYEAGLLYAEAVEGKGPQRIAILTGIVGSTNLEERDRGFKDGLTEAGADFEIAVTVPGNDDLSKSVDAVESTLRGDPSINGFFFDGPWPLLVEQSNLPLMVEKVKADELTVVSFDTLQAQLSWVEDGLVEGLVGQKYYGWGYQGVQVLEGILRNGDDFGEFGDTGIDIVTEEGGDGRIAVSEMNGYWESGEFSETPLEPVS